MGCSVLSLFPFFILSSSLLLTCVTGNDRIKSGEMITENQILVSAGDTFALGFFRPGNSTKRYLGIWYHNIPVQTVVWVANREKPLTKKSSGSFTVNDDGNIVVLDGKGNVIWSSNASGADIGRNNTFGLLMDSGNLVLRHSNQTDLWQSFDHPSDTLLPNMRIGLNLKTGQSISLTSWTNEEDPAPGEFSLGVDVQRSIHIFIWRKSNPYVRGDVWDGRLFQGGAAPTGNYAGFNSYFVNDEWVYMTVSLSQNLNLLRYKLDQNGQLVTFSWLQDKNQWDVLSSVPQGCDFYGRCGPNGSCDQKIKNSSSQPLCKCLIGFEPRVGDEWDMGNWSRGCERQRELSCDKTNGFLRFERMKLPDHSITQRNLSMPDCETECRRNCSCTAYAFSNFSDGFASMCMIWVADFMDLVQDYYGGLDLYVRLDGSELAVNGGTTDDKKRRLVAIAVATVVSGLFLIGAFVYVLWWGGEEKRNIEANYNDSELLISKNCAPELSIFSFGSVLAATDNFSATNRLGEGGFGPVYKGCLPDGQEIAVKRLSKESKQGFEEFMNELKLIAKLQHRNLVRLLGCCVQGNEKILIYEYMPNKSLNKLLFDPTKQASLDWHKRFHIIEGIAQGLLYLHKYSRLKVIHRDLKPSNILLDEEMNPKISDFGMAKIFGLSQTQANTRRLVGTLGYMSPEYAWKGIFSEKSDVYSFGVLLLEIVSGKRNTGMNSTNPTPSLLGHAWQLWIEGRAVELIDPSIKDSFLPNEVVKCIHVGLLCVQEDPVERPTMSSVLSVLSNEIVSLPLPKEPTFSVVRKSTAVSSPLNTLTNQYSINYVTITMEEPR